MVGVVETITVGGKIISVGRAAKKMFDWLKAPSAATREFLAAGHTYDEEFQAKRLDAVVRYLSDREAKAPDPETFVAAVASMIEDHQFAKVHRNLEFEAIREATNERRRMLAHAAAGLSDPNMSINEKARIERTLRALDPDDILALRRIVRDRRSETAIAEHQPISHAALFASGCLISNSGMGGTWGAVSGIAKSVLHVLETYTVEG